MPGNFWFWGKCWHCLQACFNSRLLVHHQPQFDGSSPCCPWLCNAQFVNTLLGLVKYFLPRFFCLHPPHFYGLERYSGGIMGSSEYGLLRVVWFCNKFSDGKLFQIWNDWARKRVWKQLLKPYFPTSDCQCLQDFVETWRESAEPSQTNPSFLLCEFELWKWESVLSCL